MIQTILEAEAALQPYVPLVKELTGKDTTLKRIQPLMQLLGNPQDRLRIVHIAGTSGKTSTAYYMAALLTAGGKKTGLTVSPHVDSITERVQVNGKPLSEADFCEKLRHFLKIIEPVKQKPSYFELLYAFALWVFADEQVDYAVVETGVGGLHDATNVAERPDKVCIITDIGFDHMKLLGSTLPEIASQKIGIVHSGNQAFTYRQSDEVMAVFEAWTQQQGAEMTVVTEPTEVQPFDAELPDYQRRNWWLAYQTFLYLAQRDSLSNLTSQELQETQQVLVPGRMEVTLVSGKKIVMDGAHNQQKLTAFIASFRHAYPGVKPVVLVAFKEDKAYQSVAPLLASFADQFIVTTFNTSQDLPVKSVDPELVAKALRTAGAKDVESIPDQQQALQALLAATRTVGVITGSFYLLSQIRSTKLLV